MGRAHTAKVSQVASPPPSPSKVLQAKLLVAKAEKKAKAVKENAAKKKAQRDGTKKEKIM